MNWEKVIEELSRQADFAIDQAFIEEIGVRQEICFSESRMLSRLSVALRSGLAQEDDANG